MIHTKAVIASRRTPKGTLLVIGENAASGLSEPLGCTAPRFSMYYTIEEIAMDNVDLDRFVPHYKKGGCETIIQTVGISPVTVRGVYVIVPTGFTKHIHMFYAGNALVILRETLEREILRRELMEEAPRDRG